MAELVLGTYAKSLFEVSNDGKLTSAQNVCEELSALKGIFEINPDYVKLLSSPAIGKEQKHALLDESFSGKLSDYTLNFLKLLVTNGRFGSINSIITEYVKINDAHSGIMQITAITATQMDDTLKQKLSDKLCAVTGKKVILNTVLDSSILGGIKLRYDNSEVDASVSTKLNEIKQIIKQQTI